MDQHEIWHWTHESGMRTLGGMTTTQTLPATKLCALVAGIRTVVAARADWAETAKLVAEQLRRHLPSPDILNAEQRLGSPDGYRSHTLHIEPDGSFSIVVLVWRPGQVTRIHDHLTWCVFGVIQGGEHEELFDADLNLVGRRDNHVGDVNGFAPPGDIHRVRNTAAITAISIHIYGTDVTRTGSSVRRYYDWDVASSKGGIAVNITEMFIASAETEQTVVDQIGDDQWKLMMPERITHRPMSLMEVVRYHVWDSAWIPDGLAGKTIEEVGDSHEHLLELTSGELKGRFREDNQRAIAAVRGLTDLDEVVHLTYGDFPAREYLRHNIANRAFWSYDMAKLIGVNFTLTDAFVHALLDEFSPVAEGYRAMGIFPPEVEVASNADAQTKLLGMVGRS
jgi:3-mercaptopropionate dioxygenase